MFLAICAGAVSASVTFMRIDLTEMRRAMGYPQIEMMKQFSFMQGPHTWSISRWRGQF